MQIQPRLIRLRDAPDYLGMDRNRFNRYLGGKRILLKKGRRTLHLGCVSLTVH